MQQIRFNHVFVTLMLLSVLSAFVIPQKYTDRVRNVQGLFAPVSRPIGSLAGYIHGRVAPDKIQDNRTDDDIRKRIAEAEVTIANLEGQLEALKKLNADREMVGRVRAFCTPVSVVGAGTDTGRDSLSLSVSRVGELQKGMPVVYGYGLVGRIDRASPAGAQVRLITDVGVRVTGEFGRFVRVGDHDEFQATATEVPLIEGLGKGVMVVRNLDLKQVKDLLKEGDWAVLNDTDWPMTLSRMQVGKIVSIRPRRDAPLKAEIMLQPMKNLSELREVQVMTRQQ